MYKLFFNNFQYAYTFKILMKITKHITGTYLATTMQQTVCFNIKLKITFPIPRDVGEED